jgi:hypothetical protein
MNGRLQKKVSVLISSNVSKSHILKKGVMVAVGAHVCQLKEICTSTGTQVKCEKLLFCSVIVHP